MIRFREPMDVAMLSGHRRVPTFGMEGGESGELGKNFIRRADGRLEPMAGCAQDFAAAGDAVIIETPTGGGWGRPE